jgi:uncharacterized membrane protein
MSPLVVWPAVLGLSFFAAGLYTYRGDIFGRASNAGSRILSIAPVFIAAPLATFAGEHFTAADELAKAVPKWLPWHVPIAYFVGVALVAAALSFVARRCMQWSAPLLALIFALFVLTLHLPNAIAHAGKRFFWVLPFRESEFALGALSVFVYESQGVSDEHQGAAGEQGSSRFALFARLWTAIVVIYFGTQNILYPQYSPGVPAQRPTSAWVPLPHFLAYLTGTILVVLGAAMLFKKAAVLATTLVGVFMTVLTVFLFGPDLFLARGVQQQVTAINFVADTLLFAGTMFAVARAITAPVSEPAEPSAIGVPASG